MFCLVSKKHEIAIEADAIWWLCQTHMDKCNRWILAIWCGHTSLTAPTLDALKVV